MWRVRVWPLRESGSSPGRGVPVWEFAPARWQRAAPGKAGFAPGRVDRWGPPAGDFFDASLRWHNLGVKAVDVVRFLRPASRFAPLNRFFSNHIWVVAGRR